jgi:hypothetical protein
MFLGEIRFHSQAVFVVFLICQEMCIDIAPHLRLTAQTDVR